MSGEPRWVRKAARKGHNAHDGSCRYWAGDFAGVDMNARCLICRPNDQPTAVNNHFVSIDALRASGAEYPEGSIAIESVGGVRVFPPTDDPVNHPKHYGSHPSGVECIDITRHMGFNLGNAFKYIWRADLKGKAIEDLEKAVWYLNDEINKRKKEQEHGND